MVPSKGANRYILDFQASLGNTYQVHELQNIPLVSTLMAYVESPYEYTE